MTQWALGFISTVRIGAGAWRNSANTIESGDTDQAMTQIHDAKQGTMEQQETREDASIRPIVEHRLAYTPAHSSNSIPPLPRATPLHSVALRAASSH